jgi:hypothetical protein
MRRFILPLAILALAACSRSEPEPSESTSAAPTAAAPSPAAPAQIAVVPERFQGIWDYEKGTCDPDSDLRVEIAERGITFYESHGAVTALTVESPEAIVVDLAMQGEGEKWTMQRRFTLSNGDRTLIPEATDGEKLEPMPLKRCA